MNILCWTYKQGERFIPRGLLLGGAGSTSHLVYKSSRVPVQADSNVLLILQMYFGTDLKKWPGIVNMIQSYHAKLEMHGGWREDF